MSNVTLQDALEEASRHYVNLSIYEKHHPGSRILSDIVSELGAKQTTLRLVYTRHMKQELIVLLAGDEHEYTTEAEQIELLQSFSHTAGLLSANAAVTRRPGPGPAKRSKDRKLFAAKLQNAVMIQNDHHAVMKLAQRWYHLGAKVLHEELRRQCSISAPMPEPDQSMGDYAAKLPLICLAYRRVTLTMQINTLSEQQPRRPSSRLSQQGVLRALSQLSRAEISAILAKPLPELPAGHCGYCRKPGHQEEDCRAKRLYQAYSAGVRPNSQKTATPHNVSGEKVTLARVNDQWVRTKVVSGAMDNFVSRRMIARHGLQAIALPTPTTVVRGSERVATAIHYKLLWKPHQGQAQVIYALPLDGLEVDLVIGRRTLADAKAEIDCSTGEVRHKPSGKVLLKGPLQDRTFQ